MSKGDFDPGFYDEFDLQDARSVGYWQGVGAGAGGMVVLCLLIGIYFSL